MATESLPLYAEWMCGILCAAFSLNLLVGICGAICQRLGGKHGALPFYTGFPTVWDILYTALFFAYYVYSSVLSAGEQDGELLADRNILLISIIVTGLQYVPMVLRLLLLPGAERSLRLPCGEGCGTLPPLPAQCSSGGGMARFMRELVLAFSAALGLLLATALYEKCGLMQLIVKATGCPEYQDIVQVIFKGDWINNAIVIAGAVIIAPIGEECCYRGFLYGALRKYSGKVAAVLCSSLLFAAVHMSLASLLPLFLFAVVQCLLYEKTRSLRAPIMLHAIFNAVEVCLAMMFPPHA